MARLPRTVWILGVVSLLTDLATDMIFPLLPAFLVGVLGASATGLGLIEGVAEGTSALLRLVSGRLADRRGRRKGLVVFGYGLSGLVKPLMALVVAPWQVLGIRFADRVGKGFRSAPRDALLAASATPENRGRVFGLHRALDTAGAILGPLAALAVLALAPGQYRLLFGLAAIPGLVALGLLVVAVREPETPVEARPPATFRGDVRALGRPFYGVLAVVLLFTLGNSSDAFALLRAQQVGIAPPLLPLVWLGFNVIYTAVAAWSGGWSDRAGRRRVVVLGLALYALAYTLFGLAAAPPAVLAAFAFYGVYYGLTEGVLRATVADVVPVALRGTAYGVYYATTGLGLFAASLAAGVLWDRVGPGAPFGMGAVLAALAALLALRFLPRRA